MREPRGRLTQEQANVGLGGAPGRGCPGESVMNGKLRPRGWLCLVLLVLTGAYAVIGTAQTSTSRLDGTVTDPAGAVVPGAKITAANNNTQAKSETTTSGSGSFVFPSLLPGSYTMTVEAAG